MHISKIVCTYASTPQAKVASRALSAPRRKSAPSGKYSKRQRLAEQDFVGGELGAEDISETHDFTSDVIGKCQVCSGVITGAQRVMACSALMCHNKMHSECASDGFLCHNEDDF